MVGHSGTLIDGDPVVCGGYSEHCYQYVRSTKNWKKVNLLESLVLIHKNITIC